MKRFFLIDLENVGSTFLQGLNQLTVSDTVYVCHNLTINNKLKGEIDKKLPLTKAIVKRMEIANFEKNAMDFQLMVLLGYLVATYGNGAKYFVVSNDKGFDVAADFTKNFEGLNAEVRRITSLVENFAEEDRIAELEEEIAGLIPEYSKKVVKIVRQGIDASRTTNQLNNYMQKHLFKDYTKIFPRVKHLVVDDETKRPVYTRKRNWTKMVEK